MVEIPKKYWKSIVNLLVAGGIIILGVFLIPKIILLFLPFVFGWSLALLANPFVRFLENKLKIKRKAGSALVIVVIVAGICFILYIFWGAIVKGAVKIGNELPGIWHLAEMEFVSIKEKWMDVADNFPKEVVVRAEEMVGKLGKEMNSFVAKISVPTVDTVGDFAQNIPGILMAVVMSLLSAYFFVAEKNYVLNLITKYCPKDWSEKIILLKKTTVDVLVGYVKAQFKIELWIYLLIAAGLMMLKVPYGYLVAFVIALLDILPVLGAGVVLIPWAIFKALKGQYMFSMGLLIIWGIGQLLRQIIQPKVIGDSMGLAPIPTLILLYAGYKLAGVTGMIAAVPFGILVLAMNEVGFFEQSKNSMRILWEGFQRFVKFTPEEIRPFIKKNETSESQVMNMERTQGNFFIDDVKEYRKEQKCQNYKK